MTAITPGQPLVVFDHWTACNGRGHEFRVITDGYRAYAEHEGAEATLFSRSTAQPSVIETPCPVVDQISDERCHGTVSVDLTECWWEHADAGRLSFLAYGEQIED